MFEFMTIRELYELMHASRMEIDSIEYVQLQGWIRTNRCSGKLGFIELNDGTYFRNAQLVYTCLLYTSMLCEGSKFEQEGNYRYAGLDSFTGIILDEKPKKDLEKALKNYELNIYYEE